MWVEMGAEHVSWKGGWGASLVEIIISDRFLIDQSHVLGVLAQIEAICQTLLNKNGAEICKSYY